MISRYLLFTESLEELFNNLKWRNGRIKTGSEYLSNLQFADDIELFGECNNDLKTIIKKRIEKGKSTEPKVIHRLENNKLKIRRQ